MFEAFTDRGFGLVRCAAGHRHWGRFGAAGLLLSVRGDEPVVLLQKRSRMVQHGGTWGLPGGALHRHEGAVDAALRETAEETDLDCAAIRIVETYRDDHGGWAYTTAVGETDRAMPVSAHGFEVSAVGWFRLADVPMRRLHPGLAAAWPRLVPLLG